jgi:hypothetical protein
LEPTRTVPGRFKIWGKGNVHGSILSSAQLAPLAKRVILIRIPAVATTHEKKTGFAHLIPVG